MPMRLELCDAPDDSELAIRNPEGGLHGYEELTRTHYAYWLRRERKVRDDPSVAIALADVFRIMRNGLLYDALSGAGNGSENTLKSELKQAELARLLRLNALAFSIFLRGQGGDAYAPLDAIGHGKASVSMQAGIANEKGLPFDFRLHMLIADRHAGPRDEWGRNSTGTLYVRQVHPVQTAGGEELWVAQVNKISSKPIDPTQWETILPYLASRIQ